MNSSAETFFKKLLETPGPSGYEEQVQEIVREYASPFADSVSTDAHGNVIVCKNPEADFKLMLAGHCDQIGMLITHIDEDGFLYAQTIGGWDPQQLIGQRMTVWTEEGGIPAVIARKPIHLLTPKEREQVVQTKELWLDIGAKNKEEASQLVCIGDPVTLELGYQPMRNGLANSPGMDNRTGVWVVIEALRRAAEKGVTIGLYAVSTVAEEIGLRGAQTSAYGIDPTVGIAVDVTHATDCPTIDKKQNGDLALGKGPVIYRGPNINPVVFRRITEVANGKEHPYQLSALGRAAPNDSNAIQITRAGVATGLVAIPNRYMHSAVETISLDDIDHAAELLADFACELKEGDSFTP
ncbi:MAG: M42 family metallopeptidase [Pirellulaceae bacterium]|nr:M42 family metallopeptidase [Pirellulaceae bacterium]